MKQTLNVISALVKARFLLYSKTRKWTPLLSIKFFNATNSPLYDFVFVPVDAAGTGDDVIDGLLSSSAAAADAEDASQQQLSTQPLCSYILIESLDQLLLNVTPHALDVITEISEVTH